MTAPTTEEIAREIIPDNSFPVHETTIRIRKEITAALSAAEKRGLEAQGFSIKKTCDCDCEIILTAPATQTLQRSKGSEEIAREIIKSLDMIIWESPEYESRLIELITKALDARTLVLPKKHDIVGREHPEKYGHAYGWNDCIEAIKRLNPWSKV